jgi:hypothetical protein
MTSPGDVCPVPNCVSSSLDARGDACSCLGSAAFILVAPIVISLTSMGPFVGIGSAPSILRTPGLVDIGFSVTFVKAVACWRIVDPTFDGGFGLAVSLFASVDFAEFLPLAPLLVCDLDTGVSFTVSVGSSNRFVGSAVSLTVCFFGIVFLGFDLDDCSITITSSSKVAAFFGLPRFFTVSLDMIGGGGGGSN